MGHFDFPHRRNTMLLQRFFAVFLAAALALGAPVGSRAEDTDMQRQLKQLVELVAESNRRIAELQKQVAELKQDQKIEQLNREVAALRAQLIEAQTNLAAMKNRNQQLEAQLQRIIREQGQERPGKQIGQPKDVNPPPEQVEGTVQQVDPAGLFKISIGSDAGLARGHTLEVFSLKPEPKYRGTIRIIEVGPRSAVAQSVGKLASPIQVGDQVTSKLDEPKKP
jgi:hypothetical protein